MATDSWSSVLWEVETEGEVPIWHKHNVPYISNANSLQNLDIWIPTGGKNVQEVPDSSTFPTSKGLWVIYIHGGAWRDPLVTSASFVPTIKELAAKHSTIFSNVAGFASINYSLSPRSIGSGVASEEGRDFEPSRTAKHPDHIIDVLTGISYLQSKAGFGSNYVLVGHSCGATLAFQVAMSHSKWGQRATEVQVVKPKAVIGLNGLYDMPNLISNPGDRHVHLKPVYESFTRLAFGDDEKLWCTMSPVSVSDWKAEWEEGTNVYLVQSHEDSLVPYRQTQDMQKGLLESKGDELVITELDAAGDHNELWENGDRLAEIVVEVVMDLINR